MHAGDFIFVYQSGQATHLLPYVIERKTVDDLLLSMNKSKFKLQWNGWSLFRLVIPPPICFVFFTCVLDTFYCQLSVMKNSRCEVHIIIEGYPKSRKQGLRLQAIVKMLSPTYVIHFTADMMGTVRELADFNL